MQAQNDLHRDEMLSRYHPDYRPIRLSPSHPITPEESGSVYLHSGLASVKGLIRLFSAK